MIASHDTLPSEPREAPPRAHPDLLSLILSSTLSLPDLAASLGVSVRDVLSLCQSPDVQAQLDAIDHLTRTRLRIHSAQARLTAIQALESLATSAAAPVERRRAASNLVRVTSPVPAIGRCRTMPPASRRARSVSRHLPAPWTVPPRSALRSRCSDSATTGEAATPSGQASAKHAALPIDPCAPVIAAPPFSKPRAVRHLLRGIGANPLRGGLVLAAACLSVRPPKHPFAHGDSLCDARCSLRGPVSRTRTRSRSRSRAPPPTPCHRSPRWDFDACPRAPCHRSLP